MERYEVTDGNYSRCTYDTLSKAKGRAVRASKNSGTASIYVVDPDVECDFGIIVAYYVDGKPVSM